jgi:hypothetical protein
MVTGLVCYLEIQNFPENKDKIIPFFNQYPLKTIKEKDYKDF